MAPENSTDAAARDDQPNRLAALPLFAAPSPDAPRDPPAPHTAEPVLRVVPPVTTMPPPPTAAEGPTISVHRVGPDTGNGPTSFPPGPPGPRPTLSATSLSPLGSRPPERPVAAVGEVDWGQVRAFRQQAAELLTARLSNRLGLAEQTRREIGRALIVEMLNDYADSLLTKGNQALSATAQHALTTAIYDSLFGLGRLQPLVDDPYVENIEIRGFDQVLMVYGDGRVQAGPPVADSDEELIETLAFLASQSGRAFTPLNWELDLQLHGGHRLAARAWRCPRPVVVIRVHRYTDIDLSDLRRLGMIDDVLAEFLAAAVRAGKSMVVTGGQGAGKTTLVRALCNEIAPTESIITIETERELHLDTLPDRHHRVVSFEGRPGSGERGLDGRSAGEVTLQHLLVQALRLNADRIIVGEVRGPEILQMLKAAQAAKGTLSTTHAYSARSAIERLATCALEAGPHVTADFAYRLISGGIDLIVQIGVDDQTHAGGRKHRYVSEVIELTEGEHGRPAVSDVFTAGPDGRAVPRTRPTFLSQLQSAGFDPAWLDQPDGTWKAAGTAPAGMRERR